MKIIAILMGLIALTTLSGCANTSHTQYMTYSKNSQSYHLSEYNSFDFNLQAQGEELVMEKEAADDFLKQKDVLKIEQHQDSSGLDVDDFKAIEGCFIFLVHKFEDGVAKTYYPQTNNLSLVTSATTNQIKEKGVMIISQACDDHSTKTAVKLEGGEWRITTTNFHSEKMVKAAEILSKAPHPRIFKDR